MMHFLFGRQGAASLRLAMYGPACLPENGFPASFYAGEKLRPWVCKHPLRTFRTQADLRKIAE
ncbi:hypothetical protein ACO0LO_13525 [Undibacterium sp. TJN25]|uniref:hypothetical protein n=1 Tax=Undibacterium sp. TJN25 TaxID=3413056 RepID=UPI003BF06F1F